LNGAAAAAVAADHSDRLATRAFHRLQSFYPLMATLSTLALLAILSRFLRVNVNLKVYVKKINARRRDEQISANGSIVA